MSPRNSFAKSDLKTDGPNKSSSGKGSREDTNYTNRREF